MADERIGEHGGEHGGETGRAELRRSEERFRLLVESVVDYAIFMLDPHGIVESWNIGAERLKGYRADEIVGKHYATFYTEENRKAGRPEWLLGQARELGSVQDNGWRVRKDGSQFWADVVITALHDESGSHTGYAKVTRDMTDSHLADEARERALEEQRQTVARLEHLDTWRVQFISSIVHDLQTPVAGITGFAELLLDPIGDDAESRQEFAQLIRSNARSLQELIDNLRAHARLTERRVELAPRRVDVRALVDRIIADMGPVLAERAVSSEVEDIEVSADAHALERVLRNLLSNAARHTPTGTGIRVRAYADGGDVVIEVGDDGEGIPEELRSRMFERFERGAGGGTGLGLSIAKQYVELHGGTIAVDSELGAGTTVRFTIPQVAGEPAHAATDV